MPLCICTESHNLKAQWAWVRLKKANWLCGFLKWHSTHSIRSPSLGEGCSQTLWRRLHWNTNGPVRNTWLDDKKLCQQNIQRGNPPCYISTTVGHMYHWIVWTMPKKMIWSSFHSLNVSHRISLFSIWTFQKTSKLYLWYCKMQEQHPHIRSSIRFLPTHSKCSPC